MGILNKIFSFGKKRDNISCLTSEESFSYNQKKDTLKHAKEFVDALFFELVMVKKIDELLNEAYTEFNPKMHIKVTTASRKWLNDGKPLVVLFEIGVIKPVYAYFEGDD